MTKQHEIRDPIHVFIRLDSDERKVLDSRPLQRLRHIHQLALTSLVYPGATHKRFEHSLGVMELAGRVYDVITQLDNLDESIRNVIPDVRDDHRKGYWRRVLRMAALCHDIGHLPFSHAAEKELLPEGWNHERLTAALISCEEMKTIWDEMRPQLVVEDIVKVALGPEKHLSFSPEVKYNEWETLLAEIIVGDTFGVDRMDYLLRDSYHSGVAYGRFDHHRLIDTMRILRKEWESHEICLGVEEGGLHSAEALLLARYWMYTQVYFHHIRRIYDIHLREFLKDILTGGKFSTEVNEHLRMDDNKVLSAIEEAARKSQEKGHVHACKIIGRNHFKVLYKRTQKDFDRNPNVAEIIYNRACKQFNEDNVRYDKYFSEGGNIDFPVRLKEDKSVHSSLKMKETLERLPPMSGEYVFISREVEEKADKWLEDIKEELLSSCENKGGNDEKV